MFSKKVRRPCYWCYTQTHTHNGFTPDTRRVVGRPGSAWREVSVRSTGFHYPWTGRRQPGGTLEQEVYKQREIRLVSEPVGTAVQATVRRLSPAPPRHKSTLCPTGQRYHRTRVIAALGFPGKRLLVLTTHQLIFTLLLLLIR